MADGALEVKKEEFLLNPCDTPRGNIWFDKEALTPDQKQQIYDLKIKAIKDDNRYLAAHPEIRTMILLLLKSFFRDKPRTRIAQHAAKFFSRPRSVIAREVRSYMKARGEPRKKEGDSAVTSIPSVKSSLVDLSLATADLPSPEHKTSEWWTKDYDYEAASGSSSLSLFVIQFSDDSMVADRASRMAKKDEKEEIEEKVVVEVEETLPIEEIIEPEMIEELYEEEPIYQHPIDQFSSSSSEVSHGTFDTLYPYIVVKDDDDDADNTDAV